MSLIQSPLLFAFPKLSFSKQNPKTNKSLFSNPRQTNYVIRTRGTVAVDCVGDSRLTSQNSNTPELPKSLVEEIDVDDNAGIGISNFFAGKCIFITGATGLLGKVLLEKILRATDVSKIYLLIKAENKEALFDRLANEIIGSQLFKSLKEVHGKSYEAFIRAKLIPIVGDVCKPNLGMDSDSANTIKKDVDVIIASAANTNFNERYDLLLNANVIATQRLMWFAKTCKNLKLFTHISTAFVNGKREGMILEKPLNMGENGREDNNEIHSSFPRLDIANEIQMAFELGKVSGGYNVTKNLIRLGQERADFFGWNNTYSLTKAMGEMVLKEIREDIPLLIIRPSIIESVYKEPVRGWIQGYRMGDPVIISYGKGQLPAWLADGEVAIDVVPVDIVSNVTIAAMAKHGAMNKPQMNVYHVSTSAINPLRFSDAFEYAYQYFNSSPLVEDEPIERMKLFDNFEDFSKYIREEIPRHYGQKGKITGEEKTSGIVERRCKAMIEYAEQMCKLYEYAGFLNARFHMGNTQKLLGEMSREERLDFEVDVMKIDWKKYFLEIHWPGLIKHVINDK